MKDYRNIKIGLEEEKKDNSRSLDQIDQFLQRRENKEKKFRSSYVRESISVIAAEVNLANEFRKRLALFNPDQIPNKSEIYRIGLQSLKNLSTEELSLLLSKLT